MGENFNSIHAIGNKMVCCYGKGPEIFEIFGPQYSSPSMLTMTLADDTIKSDKFRESGTCIWKHTFKKEGRDIGNFLEFAPPDSPLYVRDFNFSEPVNWNIDLRHDVKYIDCKDLAGKGHHAFMVRIPAGTFFYFTGENYGMPEGYPITKPRVLVISFEKGNVYKIDGKRLTLTVKNSPVYFAFSNNDSEAIEVIKGAIANGSKALLEKTRKHWMDFTKTRLSNMPVLNDSKYKNEILKSCDDVAVLCAAQQGKEGGVLAGHNYHLAYVRDQYGLCRGLLEIGCFDEVKAVINYYNDIYSKFGQIKNAQGVGNEAFHVHENDDVEMTGYLILTILDYYDYTKDETTVKNSAPLIRQLQELQHKHLNKGMLSFNGDETYIAGGVLPRNAIFHGSSESTMLYHRACQKLFNLSFVNDILDQPLIEKHETAMKEIEKTFKDNFIFENKLYCNQPSLNTVDEMPPYRHAVRECGHGFGWSFKNEKGRYVCIDCLLKDIGEVEDKRYYVRSVAFLPDFIKTDLVPDDVIAPSIDETVNEFLTNGYLSSRPGTKTTVGYDYGLLLNSLNDNKVDIADKLFSYILSMRDEVGAWWEYYEETEKFGTQCRPWESAINIFSLVKNNNRFFK